MELAAINAWILCKETFDENISRKNYLNYPKNSLMNRDAVEKKPPQKQERKPIYYTPENTEKVILMTNLANSIAQCMHKYVYSKCSSKITYACKICTS